LLSVTGFSKKFNRFNTNYSFFAPQPQEGKISPARQKIPGNQQRRKQDGNGLARSRKSSGITRYWTFSFAKTLNGDVPVPLEQAQGP